jgi:hypothetical protein
MKTLSLLAALLMLSGCASMHQQNPNRVSMADLRHWEVDCLTKRADVELLEYNRTTPNSRLRSMLTLDPDAHSKNTREYDAAIEFLLSEYRKCPGSSKW